MRVILAVLFLAGCAHAPPVEEPTPVEIPFKLVDRQLEVSAMVNDGASQNLFGKFLFDTGIGVTLLSERVCKNYGCAPQGQFVGKRMSGQEIPLALMKAPGLFFGSLRRTGETVGVFDLEKLGPGLAGVLSLNFFRDAPFTLDFPSKQIVLETPASLEKRRNEGTRIPVKVVRDGPSMTVFLPLKIEGLPTVWAELDTGSDSLILDERFRALLGVPDNGPSIKRVEGTDETGHAFVRLFTQLPVPVSLEAAPDVAQRDAPVLFQKIIHDGLVGVGFLKTHVVTFDLPRNEVVIFRAPVRSPR